MPGKIKMTIDVGGAVAIDMSGFKKCSDKTKELMKDLEMDVSDMRLKEEEVQQVTTNQNRVNVKR